MSAFPVQGQRPWGDELQAYIDEAIAAAVAGVQSMSEVIIKPEQFGEVGTGDDTAVVLAAANAASAARVPVIGGNVYRPGATLLLDRVYNLGSLTAPIPLSCNVNGVNAMLITPAGYSQPAVLVGHDTSGNVLTGAHIDLPHLRGSAPTSHAAGSIGATVRNLYHSILNFGRVEYFETAHRYTGKGMGTAYNRIFPGWIDLCKVGMRLDSGTGDGWVNQNIFEGGGISQSPVWAVPNHAAGWRHLVMEGGSGNSIHGNTFKTSYEGTLSSEYFHLHNAAENNWMPGTRFETGEAGRDVLMASDLVSAPHTDIYMIDPQLAVDDMVCFSASAYPSPMEPGKPYYVKTLASDHFSVSETKGGTAVTFATGSAAVKLLRPPRIVNDNTDQNTYGNQIMSGYNSSPGPLEKVQIGPVGPGPRTGITF